jgi:hypothetical protein
MMKFYGKYPIKWIIWMEKYFNLHQVPSLQKVPIASLYLENDQFVWYLLSHKLYLGKANHKQQI